MSRILITKAPVEPPFPCPSYARSGKKAAPVASGRFPPAPPSPQTHQIVEGGGVDESTIRPGTAPAGTSRLRLGRSADFARPAPAGVPFPLRLAAQRYRRLTDSRKAANCSWPLRSRKGRHEPIFSRMPARVRSSGWTTTKPIPLVAQIPIFM